jgi:molybdenum cofactor guanylyltransferase
VRRGPDEAEGFVLAGGLSSRMGQDKALLRIAGRTLLEIALDKLGSLNGPAARIVAGRSELSCFGPVIPDVHPGCGPLSGIEAALAATTLPLNVFVPVDIPLLPARLLGWMLLRAQITGALATVPRILGRPQPLCAVYHRDLLAPIATELLAGNYKVMPVVAAAAGSRIDVFDVERLAATDPEVPGFSTLPPYRWFHNCNTPEDMAALKNALVLSQ